MGIASGYVIEDVWVYVLTEYWSRIAITSHVAVSVSRLLQQPIALIVDLTITGDASENWYLNVASHDLREVDTG